MALNKSGNVVAQITDACKLQTVEVSPLSLKNDIQPTIDINPKYSPISSSIGSHTSSGAAATLYDTAANPDKTFYITSVTLSITKDALCDIATMNNWGVYFVNNGANVYLLRIPLQTLTLQNQALTISYPYPVAVDKSTKISLSATSFTAGLAMRTATITGFYL